MARPFDAGRYTDQPEFSYLKAQTHKWTFRPTKVRMWVESQIEGRVLNLFAGETHLQHDGEIVRNDIDPERPADTRHNAVEIGEYHDPGSFDTVILDPPYSLRKANEKYNGNWIGKFTQCKDQIARMVKPGGKVITFGYSTTGMAATRGFQTEHVLVINHSGDRHDTLGVVERKHQTELPEGK